MNKKEMKAFLRRDMPVWAKVGILAVWAGMGKKEVLGLMEPESDLKLRWLIDQGYVEVSGGRLRCKIEIEEVKHVRVGREIVELLKIFYRHYVNTTQKEPIRKWGKHAKLLKELRDILVKEGEEQPLLKLERLWQYYLNPVKKKYYYHARSIEQFYRYFNEIRDDFEKYGNEVTEYGAEFTGEYF